MRLHGAALSGSLILSSLSSAATQELSSSESKVDRQQPSVRRQSRAEASEGRKDSIFGEASGGPVPDVDNPTPLLSITNHVPDKRARRHHVAQSVAHVARANEKRTITGAGNQPLPNHASGYSTMRTMLVPRKASKKASSSARILLNGKMVKTSTVTISSTKKATTVTRGVPISKSSSISKPVPILTKSPSSSNKGFSSTRTSSAAKIIISTNKVSSSSKKASSSSRVSSAANPIVTTSKPTSLSKKPSSTSPVSTTIRGAKIASTISSNSLKKLLSPTNNPSSSTFRPSSSTNKPSTSTGKPSSSTNKPSSSTNKSSNSGLKVSSSIKIASSSGSQISSPTKISSSSGLKASQTSSKQSVNMSSIKTTISSSQVSANVQAQSTLSNPTAKPVSFSQVPYQSVTKSSSSHASSTSTKSSVLVNDPTSKASSTTEKSATTALLELASSLPGTTFSRATTTTSNRKCRGMFSCPPEVTTGDSGSFTQTLPVLTTDSASKSLEASVVQSGAGSSAVNHSMSQPTALSTPIAGGNNAVPSVNAGRGHLPTKLSTFPTPAITSLSPSTTTLTRFVPLEDQSASALESASSITSSGSIVTLPSTIPETSSKSSLKAVATGGQLPRPSISASASSESSSNVFTTLAVGAHDPEPPSVPTDPTLNPSSGSPPVSSNGDLMTSNGTATQIASASVTSAPSLTTASGKPLSTEDLVAASSATNTLISLGYTVTASSASRSDSVISLSLPISATFTPNSTVLVESITTDTGRSTGFPSLGSQIIGSPSMSSDFGLFTPQSSIGASAVFAGSAPGPEGTDRPRTTSTSSVLASLASFSFSSNNGSATVTSDFASLTSHVGLPNFESARTSSISITVPNIQPTTSSSRFASGSISIEIPTTSEESIPSSLLTAIQSASHTIDTVTFDTDPFSNTFQTNTASALNNAALSNSDLASMRQLSSFTTISRMPSMSADSADRLSTLLQATRSLSAAYSKFTTSPWPVSTASTTDRSNRGVDLPSPSFLSPTALPSVTDVAESDYFTIAPPSSTHDVPLITNSLDSIVSTEEPTPSTYLESSSIDHGTTIFGNSPASAIESSSATPLSSDLIASTQFAEGTTSIVPTSTSANFGIKPASTTSERFEVAYPSPVETDLSVGVNGNSGSSRTFNGSVAFSTVPPVPQKPISASSEVSPDQPIPSASLSTAEMGGFSGYSAPNPVVVESTSSESTMTQTIPDSSSLPVETTSGVTIEPSSTGPIVVFKSTTKGSSTESSLLPSVTSEVVQSEISSAAVSTPDASSTAGDNDEVSSSMMPSKAAASETFLPEPASGVGASTNQATIPTITPNPSSPEFPISYSVSVSGSGLSSSSLSTWPSESPTWDSPTSSFDSSAQAQSTQSIFDATSTIPTAINAINHTASNTDSAVQATFSGFDEAVPTPIQSLSNDLGSGMSSVFLSSKTYLNSPQSSLAESYTQDSIVSTASITLATDYASPTMVSSSVDGSMLTSVTGLFTSGTTASSTLQFTGSSDQHLSTDIFVTSSSISAVDDLPSASSETEVLPTTVVPISEVVASATSVITPASEAQSTTATTFGESLGAPQIQYDTSMGISDVSMTSSASVYVNQQVPSLATTAVQSYSTAFPQSDSEAGFSTSASTDIQNLPTPTSQSLIPTTSVTSDSQTSEQSLSTENTYMVSKSVEPIITASSVAQAISITDSLSLDLPTTTTATNESILAFSSGTDSSGQTGTAAITTSASVDVDVSSLTSDTTQLATSLSQETASVTDGSSLLPSSTASLPAISDTEPTSSQFGVVSTGINVVATTNGFEPQEFSQLTSIEPTVTTQSPTANISLLAEVITPTSSLMVSSSSAAEVEAPSSSDDTLVPTVYDNTSPEATTSFPPSSSSVFGESVEAASVFSSPASSSLESPTGVLGSDVGELPSTTSAPKSSLFSSPAISVDDLSSTLLGGQVTATDLDLPASFTASLSALFTASSLLDQENTILASSISKDASLISSISDTVSSEPTPASSSNIEAPSITGSVNINVTTIQSSTGLVSTNFPLSASISASQSGAYVSTESDQATATSLSSDVYPTLVVPDATSIGSMSETSEIAQTTSTSPSAIDEATITSSDADFSLASSMLSTESAAAVTTAATASVSFNLGVVSGTQDVTSALETPSFSTVSVPKTSFMPTASLEESRSLSASVSMIHSSILSDASETSASDTTSAVLSATTTFNALLPTSARYSVGGESITQASNSATSVPEALSVAATAGSLPVVPSLSSDSQAPAISSPSVTVTQSFATPLAPASANSTEAATSTFQTEAVSSAFDQNTLVTSTGFTISAAPVVVPSSTEPQSSYLSSAPASSFNQLIASSSSSDPDIQSLPTSTVDTSSLVQDEASTATQSVGFSSVIETGSSIPTTVLMQTTNLPVVATSVSVQSEASASAVFTKATAGFSSALPSDTTFPSPPESQSLPLATIATGSVQTASVSVALGYVASSGLSTNAQPTLSEHGVSTSPATTPSANIATTLVSPAETTPRSAAFTLSPFSNLASSDIPSLEILPTISSAVVSLSSSVIASSQSIATIKSSLSPDTVLSTQTSPAVGFSDISSTTIQPSDAISQLVPSTSLATPTLEYTRSSSIVLAASPATPVQSNEGSVSTSIQAGSSSARATIASIPNTASSSGYAADISLDGLPIGLVQTAGGNNPLNLGQTTAVSSSVSSITAPTFSPYSSAMVSETSSRGSVDISTSSQVLVVSPGASAPTQPTSVAATASTVIQSSSFAASPVVTSKSSGSGSQGLSDTQSSALSASSASKALTSSDLMTSIPQSVSRSFGTVSSSVATSTDNVVKIGVGSTSIGVSGGNDLVGASIGTFDTVKASTSATASASSVAGSVIGNPGMMPTTLGLASPPTSFAIVYSIVSATPSTSGSQVSFSQSSPIVASASVSQSASGFVTSITSPTSTTANVVNVGIGSTTVGLVGGSSLIGASIGTSAPIQSSTGASASASSVAGSVIGSPVTTSVGLPNSLGSPAMLSSGISSTLSTSSSQVSVSQPNTSLIPSASVSQSTSVSVAPATSPASTTGYVVNVGVGSTSVALIQTPGGGNLISVGAGTLATAQVSSSSVNAATTIVGSAVGSSGIASTITLPASGVTSAASNTGSTATSFAQAQSSSSSRTSSPALLPTPVVVSPSSVSNPLVVAAPSSTPSTMATTTPTPRTTASTSSSSISSPPITPATRINSQLSGSSTIAYATTTSDCGTKGNLIVIGGLAIGGGNKCTGYLIGPANKRDGATTFATVYQAGETGV